MYMYAQSSRRSIFVLILGLALILAACQTQPPAAEAPMEEPAAEAPVQAPAVEEAAGEIITITGQEYSFSAPDTVPAGLVTVLFENKGQEPHHMQLIRLNDGINPDDFFAALQTDGEAAVMSMTSGEGGSGMIMPGASQELTLNLREGFHLLASFVADDAGVPNLAKGMLQPVVVVPGGASAETEPNADLVIIMDDFSFDMPSEVRAGRQVWKVVNQGVQWHELNVVQLAPGKTMADLNAFFASGGEGMPPFMPVGGINGFSTNGEGWAIMDLEPGSYIALCFIPDPASHMPHLALGMIAEFEAR
jgi:hypothetical protein